MTTKFYAVSDTSEEIAMREPRIIVQGKWVDLGDEYLVFDKDDGLYWRYAVELDEEGNRL